MSMQGFTVRVLKHAERVKEVAVLGLRVAAAVLLFTGLAMAGDDAAPNAKAEEEVQSYIQMNLGCSDRLSARWKTPCMELQADYRECYLRAISEGRTTEGCVFVKHRHAALMREVSAAASEEDRLKREASEVARAKLPAPKMGMTSSQVINRTSWGPPRSINTTTTAGRVAEQWVYGDGDYLYLTNGRVTAIQTSR